MDELDILKRDWQQKEQNYPKVSSSEIYKMLLKKSSSIVKWIFIISILEFVLWTIVSFLLKDSKYNQKFEEYGADNIMIPLMVLGYIILLYFFYKFYTNYKKISAVDNSRKLMEKILNTRKTVRHYVAFNLVYMAVSFFLVLGIQFNKDDKLMAVRDQAAANGDLLLFYAKTIGISVIFLAFVIGLILGFYYLIYGILLKRLNGNYDELKRMDF
ncbi:hypothetical protein SAMN03097699_1442 [Flavobacteriaceae bacterium MAR_2010_188]|nr:hypothetical protein SAMN03097699_1442 [Flavobacteriaceae bacterium MAR_2010_188]